MTASVVCYKQSSTEALIAATAYLDLFLRSITDANLMKVFVKFIMLEKCDGSPILNSLVSRVGHESQVNVLYSSPVLCFFFHCSHVTCD